MFAVIRKYPFTGGAEMHGGAADGPDGDDKALKLRLLGDEVRAGGA